MLDGSIQDGAVHVDAAVDGPTDAAVDASSHADSAIDHPDASGPAPALDAMVPSAPLVDARIELPDDLPDSTLDVWDGGADAGQLTPSAAADCACRITSGQRAPAPTALLFGLAIAIARLVRRKRERG